MREVADVPQHANSEHDKELCAFCLTLIIFFDLDRGLRRLGSISNITRSGVFFCGGLWGQQGGSLRWNSRRGKPGRRQTGGLGLVIFDMGVRILFRGDGGVAGQFGSLRRDFLLWVRH
jgi:hypothetical protein